jgi:hypothetical protein
VIPFHKVSDRRIDRNQRRPATIGKIIRTANLRKPNPDPIFKGRQSETPFPMVSRNPLLRHRVPRKAATKERILAALGGGVFGLIIGVFAALFSDNRDWVLLIGIPLVSTSCCAFFYFIRGPEFSDVAKRIRLS